VVTFLVCLVVVGGASVLILRVTLQDAFKGATDGSPSDGEPPHPAADPEAGALAPAGAGVRSRPGASSTSDVTAAAAVPQDATPVGGGPGEAAQAAAVAPEGARAVGDPYGETPVGAQHTSTARAAAGPATTPVSAATGVGAGLEDTTVGDDDATSVAAGAAGEGSRVPTRPGWSDRPDPEASEHQVAPGGGTGAATVLVEDRRPEAGRPPTDDRTPDAPAPRAGGAVSSRALRPSFGRRSSARALGAVKLLALLAVVGTMVALALGATAVLLSLAVRAAIGS
jgi:hypothetical protein